MKKNIKKISVMVFLLGSSIASQAQTWDLGGNSSTNSSEDLGTSSPTSLNFVTDGQFRMSLTQQGWLGLGIDQPRAWQEINYCPAPGKSENGLIVTLNKCHGNVIQADVYDTEAIGKGIQLFDPENPTPPVPTVFKVPFSFRTGNNTNVSNPLYNANSAPMFWVRQQSPNGFWQGSGPDKFDTKFIVMPDGSCGINIVQPRAALDVRGSNKINSPAAIFGSRSIGTSTFNSTTGLLDYYTQQVHFVPVLSENGYNQIVHKDDQGMFFTDGNGTEGANDASAFVLAPWATDRNAAIGGMRMDANGNTEFHGTLRATKVNIDAVWWSDFVFADEYRLPSLAEVEAFIKANKHLPNVPSEAEVLENGIDVANMQAIQQQKIEELTLYTIDQEKRIAAQQKKLEELEALISELIKR